MLLANALTLLAIGGILPEAAGTLYVLYGSAEGRLGGRRRLAGGAIFASALLLAYVFSARLIGVTDVNIVAVLCWAVAGLIAGYMATAGEVRFADRRDLGMFTLQFGSVSLVAALGGFFLFRDAWGPFALGALELVGWLYVLALLDAAIAQSAAQRHKGWGIALIGIGLLAQAAWAYLSLTHHI
ncbi:MAG: hypothetical protein H0X24_24435 [Ktedonobacterales bacterium]|nr:hypothetical protein [Ktedonobacterales bacterium]